MCTLLLQLHLTRDNDPEVPVFAMLQNAWDYILVSVANRHL